MSFALRISGVKAGWALFTIGGVLVSNMGLKYLGVNVSISMKTTLLIASISTLSCIVLQHSSNKIKNWDTPRKFVVYTLSLLAGIAGAKALTFISVDNKALIWVSASYLIMQYVTDKFSKGKLEPREDVLDPPAGQSQDEKPKTIDRPHTAIVKPKLAPISIPKKAPTPEQMQDFIQHSRYVETAVKAIEKAKEAQSKLPKDASDEQKEKAVQTIKLMERALSVCEADKLKYMAAHPRVDWTLSPK